MEGVLPGRRDALEEAGIDVEEEGGVSRAG
jgi:hypothetical protein